MTWEQKLAAIQAIGSCTLHMRQPGDWYASPHNVEIGGNGLLRSVCGNGRAPDEAVEDAWAQVTELPNPELYVVFRTSTGERQHVRWNGFMWADVPTQTAVTG